VRLSIFSVLALLGASCLTGCGTSNGPTAPSAPSANEAPQAAGGTAFITGSVIVAALSPSASARPRAVAAPLVVSIVGTDLSAPVDGSNRFLLQGVPSGDRELRFSGTGVDARLPIANVQDAEAIQLTVRVNGSTATVESEHRSAHSDSDAVNPPGDDDDDAEHGQDESASIEGPLTEMTGSLPALTLLVDGTVVLTDSGTVVRRRGDVQDLGVLALGMTLHVVGDRAPNGSLTARMIQIKDDQTAGAFEIEGSLGGLHGTCPAVQFVVNGFKIFTSGQTTFTPACSALKPGQRIVVNGERQADGTIVASVVDAR
jgi:hypothetical protein